MRAVEKIEEASRRNRSLLCIGLDPQFEKLPKNLLSLEPAAAIVAFNRAIIEATENIVCAYKPNLAFYERHGSQGWEALKKTIEIIPSGIPVILDAKRGDVGNTARFYAMSLYDELGGDCITVNPYLGRDSITPFIRQEKMVFLLAATSNPGAIDFQDRRDERNVPLYLSVARLGAEMDASSGTVGLVAGATEPRRLREIREAAEDCWLLVPGVGAQGGDLRAALEAGLDKRKSRVLINASRSILYASDGEDYAAAARKKAEELKDEIGKTRRNLRFV